MRVLGVLAGEEQGHHAASGERLPELSQRVVELAGIEATVELRGVLGAELVPIVDVAMELLPQLR